MLPFLLSTRRGRCPHRPITLSESGGHPGKGPMWAVRPAGRLSERNCRTAAALGAKIGPYVRLPLWHRARRASWTLPGHDTRLGNGSGCWGAGVCRFRAPELNRMYPRQNRGLEKGVSPFSLLLWVLFLEKQEKYKRLSEKPPAGRTEKRANVCANCRSCWRQSVGPAGFSALYDIEYLQTG